MIEANSLLAPKMTHLDRKVTAVAKKADHTYQISRLGSVSVLVMEIGQQVYALIEMGWAKPHHQLVRVAGPMIRPRLSHLYFCWPMVQV